jgi:hypothetical protein
MILRGMGRLVNQAWFSYLTIFLLQLKVIWGIWRYRDLSHIDTASYFVAAHEWFTHWAVHIVWYPLYTAFYGAFLHVWRDAYSATIAHRMVIVLGLSLLVLAFMRRLLPPAIAWFMAAWWVILPIDFDSIFELHLFGVFPILAAFLILLWKPGAWGRGWALAVLLAATVLLRNEAAIATLVFGVICLVWEVRQRRRGIAPEAKPALAYGVPLALACLTIAFFFTRAIEKHIVSDFHDKEVSNFCISYAFGYHQRHPEWQGSPYGGCHDILMTVYGNPQITFTDALRLNAPALWEHIRWNVSLIPNGLEVLLFNAMAGTVTPDYDFATPVPAGSPWALLASLFTALLIVMAGVRVWRDRGHWWEVWIKPRMWAWLAMASVTLMTGIVLSVRPRPSYLFAFGLVLRALVGTSLLVIASRWPAFDRLSRWMPAFMVLAIALIPPYYHPGERLLLDYYRLLQPFEARMQATHTVLLTRGLADELCNYLAKPLTDDFCQPLEFLYLQKEVSSGASWQRVLDRHGVTLFLASASVLADPLANEFVEHAAAYGWRAWPGNNGTVLERAPAAGVR